MNNSRFKAALHKDVQDEVKLDLLLGDLTLRMHTAPDFETWRDLFHRREALQVERNLLSQAS